MRLKVNKTCLINDIPIQVESFWQGNFCAKNPLKNALAGEWQGISKDGISGPYNGVRV